MRRKADEVLARKEYNKRVQEAAHQYAEVSEGRRHRRRSSQYKDDTSDSEESEWQPIYGDVKFI